MTVACAQLSAAGSLAAASGLMDTNLPLGEELMEPTPSGRLRHGPRLNLGGRRPRLHNNMSNNYKQLLSYLHNESQGHLPKNMSADVTKCTCDTDTGQGFTTITIVILGLYMFIWAISAGWYKGVYRSLMKRRCTCVVYLLVSGSFEFLIKLGAVPGHRLDYEYSATDKLRIENASGLISWKVTLNVPLLVTNRSSGELIMLGRKIKSDPVSNHLFNELARDGILNYEVVVAFCLGP